MPLAASAWAQGTLASPAVLSIVAAETVYAGVAGQVAGPAVSVSGILSNPGQDPHSFEPPPSVARALSGAQVVIYNGVDYDPWMPKLVRATSQPWRQVLVVAELLGRKPGANPHLWFDPQAMPAVARAVAAALSASDPAGAAGYAQRLQAFLDALGPVDAKVAALRTRFAATPVAATEPVFGLMSDALGLVNRNARFQLSVMNGTEPRPSDVAAFEADLKGKRIRVLFYNGQSTGPTAQRLLRLAQASDIPVVPVSETQPAGTTYQSWMLATLDAVEAALAAPA